MPAKAINHAAACAVPIVTGVIVADAAEAPAVDPVAAWVQATIRLRESLEAKMAKAAAARDYSQVDATRRSLCKLAAALDLHNGGAESSSSATSAPAPGTVASLGFTCPLKDVIAYAKMIGMDVVEDVDLLWIADEALQQLEPRDWEKRQDPFGGIYYCNTITKVTILQNPIDYHYQQLYLKLTAERRAATKIAAMQRGRIQRKAFAAIPAGAKRKAVAMAMARRNKAVAIAAAGRNKASAIATAKRKVEVARDKLPRGGDDQKAATRDRLVSKQLLFILLHRGPTGLGLELDATNTIVNIVKGGAADRQGYLLVRDTIASVDGVPLRGRLLQEVMDRSKSSYSFDVWRLRKVEPKEPVKANKPVRRAFSFDRKKR